MRGRGGGGIMNLYFSRVASAYRGICCGKRGTSDNTLSHTPQSYHSTLPSHHVDLLQHSPLAQPLPVTPEPHTRRPCGTGCRQWFEFSSPLGPSDLPQSSLAPSGFRVAGLYPLLQTSPYHGGHPRTPMLLPGNPPLRPTTPASGAGG